ncbi:MAG: NADAR family protein [Clostridia bacterium]|nr:NADAR family protein [Clostridia bacterium]
MNEIRFYKEFGPLGYLATYSAHGFEKDGIFFKTSEHYYQAQKFEDQLVRELIINAATPKIASTIGRNRDYTLRSDWEEVKKSVMFDAVYYKFKQNEDILKKLLDTGDSFIIEATVKENYWGCGPNNDGQNNYGKIVMLVRDRLRLEQHKGS